MKSNLTGIVIVTIVGLIGYAVGGLIEDTMWVVGDSLVPNCQSMEGEWKELCYKNNRVYYAMKPVFQFGGLIITGFGAYKFVKGLGLFD